MGLMEYLRIKSISCKILLVVILLNFRESAHASAGYYPLNIGEEIKTEFCASSKIKFPIYLELNDTFNNRIRVSKSYLVAGENYKCQKKEKLIYMIWKADRIGEYSLSFYSPNSKKRFYGWPDGIEISK